VISIFSVLDFIFRPWIFGLLMILILDFNDEQHSL
jgi:hypothetical protein